MSAPACRVDCSCGASPDCGTAPCTHPAPAGTWTGYAAAVGLTFILTLLVFLAGDLLQRTWS